MSNDAVLGVCFGQWKRRVELILSVQNLVKCEFVSSTKIAKEFSWRPTLKNLDFC